MKKKYLLKIKEYCNIGLILLFCFFTIYSLAGCSKTQYIPNKVKKMSIVLPENDCYLMYMDINNKITTKDLAIIQYNYVVLYNCVEKQKMIIDALLASEEKFNIE